MANTKKVRRVVEENKSEIRKEQVVSSFWDWLPISCKCDAGEATPPGCDVLPPTTAAQIP